MRATLTGILILFVGLGRLPAQRPLAPTIQSLTPSVSVTFHPFSTHPRQASTNLAYAMEEPAHDAQMLSFDALISGFEFEGPVDETALTLPEEGSRRPGGRLEGCLSRAGKRPAAISLWCVASWNGRTGPCPSSISSSSSRATAT